jgi:ribosome biogenesis protein ERB1
VHPAGDNFILGTYDKKIIWFDMDMGSKPYKNLKYHDKAIRNVQFS